MFRFRVDVVGPAGLIGVDGASGIRGWGLVTDTGALHRFVDGVEAGVRPDRVLVGDLEELSRLQRACDELLNFEFGRDRSRRPLHSFGGFDRFDRFNGDRSRFGVRFRDQVRGVGH